MKPSSQDFPDVGGAVSSEEIYFLSTQGKRRCKLKHQFHVGACAERNTCLLPKKSTKLTSSHTQIDQGVSQKGGSADRKVCIGIIWGFWRSLLGVLQGIL